MRTAIRTILLLVCAAFIPPAIATEYVVDRLEPQFFMDITDQLAMERNAQYALESTRTNTETAWRNPDTGNYGSIVPVETYQTGSGQYCREYIQEVVVAGERQQAYGTACRQPDGTWQIVR